MYVLVPLHTWNQLINHAPKKSCWPRLPSITSYNCTRHLLEGVIHYNQTHLELELMILEVTSQRIEWWKQLILYIELTIDPAPTGGIFGTMIFLYLMVCSIQKKMIATFCWGSKELWAFEIRYHLKNCHFVYLTLKHPCI